MSFAKLATYALVATIATACAPAAGGHAPARYLYVWAGTGTDTARGIDMMTVVDADSTSPTYATVLAAVTADTAGRMPHHIEFSLPTGGPLFANDYTADKTFLIDFRTPTTPALAGRVAAVPGGHRLHSFARLANGHVLATVQFGDGTVAGNPGALAEFDAQGAFIRASSSRDSSLPGARIRTYALTVIPKLDRVVTTSSPMDSETVANTVQVWRLSDLKLLKTLVLDPVPGDSANRMPFEVRTLGDNTVILNTYTCGFYHLTGLDGDPKITRVLHLPQPVNFGCSVPVIVGHFMLMPIAYAHRYATIDIADPDHPVETSSFPTDSTFFPHWAATDPGSDRVVVTDQGDGRPMLRLAHFNATTGVMSWVEGFRDKGSATPGMLYRHDRWPNGVTGMAMPHGAVFVP